MTAGLSAEPIARLHSSVQSAGYRSVNGSDAGHALEHSGLSQSQAVSDGADGLDLQVGTCGVEPVTEA